MKTDNLSQKNLFFSSNESRWIRANREWNCAPVFRRDFEITGNTEGIRGAVCGLGFHELYLNGNRVGDRVLDPTPTCYDRRAYYAVYDLTPYLYAGNNTLGVVLGNGYYNHGTDFADYNHAIWRDVPKLRLEIRDRNGTLLLSSDSSWRTAESSIVFNEFRNGEIYDARRELPSDWATPKFSSAAAAWPFAALVPGPGGLLEEQITPPCRIVDTIHLHSPNMFDVYDTGRNLAGHCRITVRGPAGAHVVLAYGEILTEAGQLDNNGIGTFIKSGPVQQDEYILKGDGVEIWESRFTCHGFQYVRVTLPPEVELVRLEAREVHTDLAEAGSIEVSNQMLNTLQTLARRSYLSNFMGIPTDCPHREHSGWLGDAHLASEIGLYNFDTASSYLAWLDSIRDEQRMSGELACVAPCSTPFYYNWGNGPSFDSALFIIAWEHYLFTGDPVALQRNYAAMKKYLEFCETMCDDTIPQWGLGDWSWPLKFPVVPPPLVNAACYGECLKIFAAAARITGYTDDAVASERRFEQLRDAFNRHFYRGNGVYAEGQLTGMGLALSVGLAVPGEEPAVLDALVRELRNGDWTARFGIFGAKAIPRVLAEHGYAGDAVTLFTQEQYPGWGNWILRGATTLWESWEGQFSHNHIMYGDVSAWLFRYAAGFRHDAEHIGPHCLLVAPLAIPAISHVQARYRGYECTAIFQAGQYDFDLTVPADSIADVRLPDGSRISCGPGRQRFNIWKKGNA